MDPGFAIESGNAQARVVRKRRHPRERARMACFGQGILHKGGVWFGRVRYPERALIDQAHAKGLHQ